MCHCAVEKDLDPGAEVHRIDDRNANVAEMTVDIARGNVEAAAERERKMRKIATYADALVKRLKGRPRRSGLHVVKRDVIVDEVANRLHPTPSQARRPNVSQAIWLSRSVSQYRLPMR